MELPVTECAWRAWRRDLDAWLQECESLVSSYHQFLLEDASRGALPRIKQNWGMVPVPGGVPWNLAMVRHQERGLAAEACRFAANQLGNTTNAFAAYRQTKAVYRVEPRLWADLAAAKFPAKYPMEHFLLPRNGMAIETKEGDQEFGVIACWDLATGREHLGELEIRFSFVDSQRVGTLHFFAALNVHQSSTLDEAWQDYLARCDAYSGSLEGVALKGLGDKGPAILGGVINTILYILNDEDVVREVHPGARPEKKSMNPVKARKFADIREPNRYHVGRDYVSVIEHWERDQANMKGEESGRGVRPHVRAAHAHLYWTGKGGRIPKVRFLAPIPVKGGHVPGDEDDPKVTKVR